MSVPPSPNIGRIVTQVEAGPQEQAAYRGWAAAIVENVGADLDLPALAALGEHIGDLLAARLTAALDCAPGDCTSYGKGAIVGTGSGIEHAAAILHPRMGRPIRAMLGRGKAIIPSTVKHGGPGACLDVPLHGIDDEWDFALLDAVEAHVPGSPRPDEIVVIVALGMGRPNAVVGTKI